MSWIDGGGPYRWDVPIARDLHKQLMNTFYELQEVRMLVRMAGAPDWTHVDFTGSVFEVWARVLDQAHKEESLRGLLTFIVNEKVAKSLTEFILDVLNDKQRPADPGAPGANGADFPSDVSKEEALLFGDDLSESVGEIAGLVKAIENVMKWRSAVCHLLVAATDGKLWHGTGTLITGNRVLTNHHVLFPGSAKCSAAKIEFNYENDAAGQKLASIVVDGDVASIRGDAADDWAVISITPPAAITAVDLAANSSKPIASERAFILQHPDGDPKRLAFVRNRIASVADRRVFYLTDTKGGSSGSPVFDARGKLIALHRAGGTPQKLTGADPVKKNEGVRMDIVAAAVAAL